MRLSCSEHEHRWHLVRYFSCSKWKAREMLTAILERRHRQMQRRKVEMRKEKQKVSTSMNKKGKSLMILQTRVRKNKVMKLLVVVIKRLLHRDQPRKKASTQTIR